MKNPLVKTKFHKNLLVKTKFHKFAVYEIYEN